MLYVHRGEMAFSGYSKMCYKKLVTHVEPYMGRCSESAQEQRIVFYIKAVNNNLFEFLLNVV